MKVILQTKLDSLNSKEQLIALLQDKFGSNSEFIFIEPKDKSYKIEEIKNFTSKLNRKQSNLTENLFYILLSGDNLPLICQNALLKTLEESEYSIGIVLQNVNSLLPTIRSRCQMISLQSTAYSLQSTENNIVKNLEIDLDYAKLAKAERNEVVLKLEETIETLSGGQVTKTLQLQNAIDKLNANCKVEAVLIDLEDDMAKI